MDLSSYALVLQVVLYFQQQMSNNVWILECMYMTSAFHLLTTLTLAFPGPHLE